MKAPALSAFDCPGLQALTVEQINDALAARPLVQCTGLNLVSGGWVPASPEGHYALGIGTQVLCRHGQEKRLLPASVVRRAVNERAEAYAKDKGFKPGRKMLRELKDQVTTELLPRAFSIRSETSMWLDLAAGRLVIASAASTACDGITHALRDALPELGSITPVKSDAVARLLSAWLVGGAEAPFELDSEAEVHELTPAGGTAKFSGFDLEDEDIKRLVRDRAVRKLALVWRSRAAFVLSDKLAITKLRWLEVVESDKTPESEMEALQQDFALLSGESASLISDLLSALAALSPASGGDSAAPRAAAPVAAAAAAALH